MGKQWPKQVEGIVQGQPECPSLRKRQNETSDPHLASLGFALPSQPLVICLILNYRNLPKVVTNDLGEKMWGHASGPAHLRTNSFPKATCSQQPLTAPALPLFVLCRFQTLLKGLIFLTRLIAVAAPTWSRLSCEVMSLLDFSLVWGCWSGWKIEWLMSEESFW